MRLERLSRMGLAEIASRSRHEATKWLERVGIAGHHEWDPEPAHGPRVTAPVRPGSLAASPFFAGATDAATPHLLASRTPASRARTLEEAERILRGRFDLLGHRDLAWGEPIDWHRDPISGRSAPRLHWTRLEGLEPIPGGDAKLVWELNRHQWMVRLGQAWRLTGDDRFAEAFADRLKAWMEENPPGVGMNWCSSLEVGLRLISWCWAMRLFHDAEAVDGATGSRLKAGILTHANHIERNLSYYFSPNTHLTGEALALFYAGLLIPEGKPAARWRMLGWRILTQQLERQVLPDGVYFEQSTWYQRYTVEIALHFIELSARHGIAVPPIVRERLGLMLDFLLAVRAPDGTMPQIGDGDGGRLLPLEGTLPPGDFSALFSTSAAMLGRADCAWAAGGLSAETIWMLGDEGRRDFDGLDPEPPQEAPSRLFPAGGYVVMAPGRSRRDHQMILDVGPLGCHVSSGHGHADLLSISCAVFGRPCLVDPGTYCYTLDGRWRSHFRGAGAHCTVSVDDEGPARPDGPFSWRERPAARLLRWNSTALTDYADAQHDAWSRLPDPVIHRRRVLFVKPRCWVVVDDFSGRIEHSVELRYQLAPAWQVSLEQSPWVAARGPAGAGLMALVHGTVPIRPTVLEGSLDPIGGWVSPAFGRLVAAPALSYRATGRFPIRIATLLFPREHTTWGAPDVVSGVTPLMSGASLRGFALSEGREFVLIDDDAITLESR